MSIVDVLLCVYLAGAVVWLAQSLYISGKSPEAEVYTDGKTGVQYISIPGRGVTPRMGLDGKPLVCRD